MEIDVAEIALATSRERQDKMNRLINAGALPAITEPAMVSVIGGSLQGMG
jgi:hypothetical protein